MTPREQELFDSVVHSLRNKGWSRIEAEGEALDRIEKRRRREFANVRSAGVR